MKTLIRACFLSLFFLMSGAFAADLTTAKSQGWIGEQNDGYLGVVKGNAPADVKALVADVNRQRKSQFAQIAAVVGVLQLTRDLCVFCLLTAAPHGSTPFTS